MNLPQGWELILLVLVVVLLFGAKRLPEAARGVGRSLRIFKAEVKQPGASNDDDRPTTTAPPAIGPAAVEEQRAAPYQPAPPTRDNAPVADPSAPPPAPPTLLNGEPIREPVQEAGHTER